MLKIVSPVIAFPVCSIINTSISTCSIPSVWKKALVKPLHKGGSKDTLANYRPISLLPVTSKILGAVIKWFPISRTTIYCPLAVRISTRVLHSNHTTTCHQWMVLSSQPRLCCWCCLSRYCSKPLTQWTILCSIVLPTLGLNLLIASGSVATLEIDTSALPLMIISLKKL